MKIFSDMMAKINALPLPLSGCFAMDFVRDVQSHKRMMSAGGEGLSTLIELLKAMEP